MICPVRITHIEIDMQIEIGSQGTGGIILHSTSLRYCFAVNSNNGNSFMSHLSNTYSIPEHLVHTNEPMDMLTYVGPRWPQSKHCLLPLNDTISRKIFRFLSICFFRTNAILIPGSSTYNSTDFTTNYSLGFNIVGIEEIERKNK